MNCCGGLCNNPEGAYRFTWNLNHGYYLDGRLNTIGGAGDTRLLNRKFALIEYSRIIQSSKNNEKKTNKKQKII